MWDNPTHGLDSSTALEFITTLRDMTKSFQQTAVVALYQAGESLTDQFDKVTVLYLGRQIFFGTLPDSKRYFEDMGFECRPHQTTADFLTAITDPTARRAKPGWEDRVPRAPEDFVKLWQSSPEYSKLRADIQDYHREFSDSNAAIANYEAYHSAIKSKRQRPGSIYTVDLPTQFSANLKRAFRRFIGDRAFLGATAFSSIYMSLIMGSLFYNVTDTTSGFFSKGGALFFAILFNSLQTMGEIAMFYSQRPIIRRQYTYAMYHPFLDALASLVVEYPYKIVNVTVFDIVLYFMVGLKQTPDAFFTLWLVTYLATLVMSAYFRTVAALTNSPEAAIGVAGISVLAYSIYTGYLIPKPSMHPWFKWITYINPLSYAFEALVANEFHDTLATCASVVPSGPEYTNASAGTQVCAVTGSEPGQLSVSGDVYIETSFDYRNSHVWRNVGILCVFLCGFVAALAVATEFMTSSSKDTRDRLCYRKGHGPDQVKGAVDEEENWKAEDVLTRTASPASANTDLVTQKLLTWEGVGYDIALHDGSQQRLLNGIDGYVRPGTLTALMGESGAGKTTLLRALAKRLHGGKISGECRVNGEPPDRSFHRMTGFVEQQDVHLASSTVREALRFSAKLRQPEEIPFTERMDYVEKVIEMLEMDDFAEAIIGTPGSGGLNIEQRKRTTIAVELVAKPEILLFLDEPTSGLDSLAAWSIVRLLRKLANSGQTILCTIHQPSSVLFEQFDRLLLLGKGGVPVYFGDVGENSQAVLRYFEERSGLSCPLGHNPAEFILDVIGTLTTRNWNEVWKNSTECHELSKDIQQLEKQFHPAPREHFKEHGHLRRDVGPGATFARPWTTQYLAVQPRLFLHHWRTPRYIMGKVSLNVLAGLFLGFTFFKEGSSVQGLQNKVRHDIHQTQP
jgi:ABC-type multidrug transport system ATPase subunit